MQKQIFELYHESLWSRGLPTDFSLDDDIQKDIFDLVPSPRSVFVDLSLRRVFLSSSLQCVFQKLQTALPSPGLLSAIPSPNLQSAFPSPSCLSAFTNLRLCSGDLKRRSAFGSSFNPNLTAFYSYLIEKKI